MVFFEKICPKSIITPHPQYIVGDENRISCYSKISKLQSLDEIKTLQKELENMYGEVPKETYCQEVFSHFMYCTDDMRDGFL